MKRILLLFLLAATAAFGATGTASVGQTETFTVSFNGGNSPYSFQWFKDGISLGAAGAFQTLTLKVASPTDAGTYYIVITDANGKTVQSDNGVLTVKAADIPFGNAVVGMQAK